MNFKNSFHPNHNKILFYYPQHFNRSERGTNPFFDSLMDACDKAGIAYDLYEEPDSSTDKPHNPKAKRARMFLCTILVIRKIVRVLMPWKNFYQRERICAHIFDIISLGSWHYSKYVSISGSMEELFLALNPKADVLEMQHGVDFSNKDSYFDNCKLKEPYHSMHWHLMSWGEGYRSCVIRGHEDEYGLSKRVHVVGYPMYRDISVHLSQNKLHGMFTILFSFQFTHDWDMCMLKRYKNVIMETLQELEGMDCEVLLKHHPRYNNCIDLSDLYSRFPFAHETKETLYELQRKTNLHVTLNSTTGFEFAEVGIPSYFLCNTDFPQHESLFYNEYHYPLYEGMGISEIVKRLHNEDCAQRDADVVQKWYKKFYSPFNEGAFLQLLK